MSKSKRRRKAKIKRYGVQKKSKFAFHNMNIWVKYLFLLLAIFIGARVCGLYNDYRLNEDGVEHEAYIYKISDASRAGTRYSYYFFVDRVEYNGYTFDRIEGKHNVGDTIRIMYSKKDPSFNQSMKQFRVSGFYWLRPLIKNKSENQGTVLKG